MKTEIYIEPSDYNYCQTITIRFVDTFGEPAYRAMTDIFANDTNEDVALKLESLARRIRTLDAAPEAWEHGNVLADAAKYEINVLSPSEALARREDSTAVPSVRLSQLDQLALRPLVPLSDLQAYLLQTVIRLPPSEESPAGQPAEPRE